MIDEKRLLEVLEKNFYGIGGVEVLKQIINEQPKVGEWIPCSERLPKEKGDYLVSYHPCYWDEVKENILVGMDYFMGKTSWSKRKYQRVIAWQPLPEPCECHSKKLEKNSKRTRKG